MSLAKPKLDAMKSARRSARADNSKNDAAGHNAADSEADLKPGEFILEAALAQSVKLAANFTEWEKNPLELTKSENGIWQLILPLPAGNHPYRFIVDGQWCDDPQNPHRAPNPFGTENSVKTVS